MPKKATAEDAKIIMRLYDLRREPEMRKARAWFASFAPRSAEDVIQLINGAPPQENAWFRQVSSYWDMAASFVLRGSLNEELFVDNSGEMFFVLGKLYPVLEGNPREDRHPIPAARRKSRDRIQRSSQPSADDGEKSRSQARRSR